MLHSPTYRETYKEFFKIDFPRVPYPMNATTFWKLVALGAELRQLHLMESPTLSQFITQYSVGGENEVEKFRFEEGKVYINSEQYFDSVWVKNVCLSVICNCSLITFRICNSKTSSTLSGLGGTNGLLTFFPPVLPGLLRSSILSGSLIGSRFDEKK